MAPTQKTDSKHGGRFSIENNPTFKIVGTRSVSKADPKQVFPMCTFEPLRNILVFLCHYGKNMV